MKTWAIISPGYADVHCLMASNLWEKAHSQTRKATPHVATENWKHLNVSGYSLLTRWVSRRTYDLFATSMSLLCTAIDSHWNCKQTLLGNIVFALSQSQFAWKIPHSLVFSSAMNDLWFTEFCETQWNLQHPIKEKAKKVWFIVAFSVHGPYNISSYTHTTISNFKALIMST